MALILMLPKEERLRREKEVRVVLETGRRVRHPLLNLYFLERPGAGRRAGFVVGRRVAQKAVVRNRVRRRLREAYRLRRHQVKSDVWFVFAAQPLAANANFYQLAAAIEDALRRARVWEERQE